MSIKALEDEDYELIKSHLVDPENSPLSPQKQEMLDRWISASKVLDKNPIQKNAIAIHHAKYSHISRSQAYQDVRMGEKIYNSCQTFNYEFWHNWLLQSITKNIQRNEAANDRHSSKIIAMEHANLIKAIGPRPQEEVDPLRNEKHEFYILAPNTDRNIKIDVNQLQDLPISNLQDLTRAICGGEEITDTKAEEIMNT
jgi:hypothetical protein